MNIGDKVTIRKEMCANGFRNPHFNRKAVVIDKDNFLVCVSIDDFPNCNHRDYHNRFWYEPEELEQEVTK